MTDDEIYALAEEEYGAAHGTPAEQAWAMLVDLADSCVRSVEELDEFASEPMPRGLTPTGGVLRALGVALGMRRGGAPCVMPESELWGLTVDVADLHVRRWEEGPYADDPNPYGDMTPTECVLTDLETNLQMLRGDCR